MKSQARQAVELPFLFDVLDLLTDLFQLRLAVHDNLRDFSVVCFGTESIQFATYLLADKFQSPPNRLLLVGGLRELTKM